MTSFGSTSDCLYANCSVRLPGPVGPDGRGGNQPRGTKVVGNVVREFGLWQKQSSAWSQQLTAETWIEGNVFFNSPRAAINFNDGAKMEMPARPVMPALCSCVGFVVDLLLASIVMLLARPPGFAGGDTIVGNLLFGHCRETTEVGPVRDL